MAQQTENLKQTSLVPGASRQNFIPQRIKSQLENLSNADECFVNQRFSGKLQAFLVSYVANITSGYGVSATTIRD